MKKCLIALLIGLVMVFVSSVAQAVSTVDLYDWGFNIDGTVYNSVTYGNVPGDLPGNVNTSGFDFGTGLGSISVTITGTGSHSLISFFDHEIDEAINGFSNEIGSVSGSAVAGQSWEIDEPGFAFGDIFSNFENGALDNGIGTPDPEDVSMAMGWDFALAAGETASIDFILSETSPAGFYLRQNDPDSDASLYFYGKLDIRGGGQPVIPEPSTVILLGSGIAGLFFFGRKRFVTK